MSKYKAERIIVKVFPELTLIFADEKSIWAICEGDKYPSIFHNWVSPRFTYRDHWLPFKRALLKRRYLDRSMCWELALRYQVPYKTASSTLNLSGKPLEIRYKRWSILGSVHEL